MFVVFYYTQSGQALQIAQSLCAPIVSGGETVLYKQIVPEEAYPFPWSKDEFFDTFPETRLGLPPSGIQPLDLSDATDADCVLIVGQSWFLSPSLPLQSFLRDETVRAYLKGRKVVFVNACRNMWLNTAQAIKQELQSIGAEWVGHIVFQDRNPNLVSLVTIIRWLIYGKKDATSLLPAAGISDADCSGAARFGEIIREACLSGRFSELQEQLLQAGAIDYRPSVLQLEKIGHKMFGLWAKFIRKKGGFRDPRRKTRVNLFYVYLMSILFLLSPFAQLFFYLTYPFRNISKERKKNTIVKP